jgi:hypothetical protein
MVSDLSKVPSLHAGIERHAAQGRQRRAIGLHARQQSIFVRVGFDAQSGGIRRARSLFLTGDVVLICSSPRGGGRHEQQSDEDQRHIKTPAPANGRGRIRLRRMSASVDNGFRNAKIQDL